MTLLLVALGAGLGAPLRYLVDRAIAARHDSLFPWGTFAVNATGSLLLGVLAGTTLQAEGSLLAFAGTGLCGALTTYSTFGYETVRLIQDGAHRFAVANVAANLGCGLGAAYLGVGVVQLIS